MTDIIDRLAGIAPGSTLDTIRRARPDAREHTERSFLALLEPQDPGGLSLLERYAVAAFVALLHDEAEPSPASRFYLELLADEAGREFASTILAEAEAARWHGPYGVYREHGLAREAEPGPVVHLGARSGAEEIPPRLVAALEHAHLLVLHPRDARPNAIEALRRAGFGPDDVVSLSQLVAFLTYQLRLVSGLDVLHGVIEGSTIAPSTTEPTGTESAGTEEENK